MNIIVTSGGTKEHIDNIRSITNKSTGELGKTISNRLADKGAKIYYVYSGHTPPSGKNIYPIMIETVTNLEKEVTKLLNEKQIHFFIHAMAVSDFKFEGVIYTEQIIKKLANKLAEKRLTEKEVYKILKSEFVVDNPEKIPSNLGDIALSLSQNIKIISLIKKLSPLTVLVGFKLLSNVSEEELFKAGYELLKKNDCAYVVANNLENITLDSHKAMIINTLGEYKTFNTKEEIAEGICNVLAISNIAISSRGRDS